MGTTGKRKSGLKIWDQRFSQKTAKRVKEFELLKVKNHGEQILTALTMSSWML